MNQTGSYHTQLGVVPHKHSAVEAHRMVPPVVVARHMVAVHRMVRPVVVERRMVRPVVVERRMVRPVMVAHRMVRMVVPILHKALTVGPHRSAEALHKYPHCSRSHTYPFLPCAVSLQSEVHRREHRKEV